MTFAKETTMSPGTILFVALAAATLAAPALAEATLGIDDARATVAYPGAPTGAAYFTLRNDGQPDDRLVGVTTDAAGSVMLHSNTETADGVMQMRPLADGMPLPDGGEIVFSPGGNHVMFMGLTPPWNDGDTIVFTLVFASGATLDVQAVVGPVAP